MKIFFAALLALVPASWPVLAPGQVPPPATTTIGLSDVPTGIKVDEVMPYVIQLTVSEAATDSPPVVGVPTDPAPVLPASRNPTPQDAVLPPPAAAVSAPRDDELHDRLRAARSAAQSTLHTGEAKVATPPTGMNLISAPKITLLPSETATLEISAMQTFTYLESAEAGRYIAKHSEPKKLGLNIKLKAEPSKEDESTVLCRLECEVSALVGREPVKGLDLDVGKPIVATWSLKTTTAAKFGTPSLVFLPSGPDRRCLLTLTVSNLEPNQDAVPHPPAKR